jgi:prolyl-tRNA synthetase
MRLTSYFLPTLKETPNEARIVSHRLMLRAGMIRQSSAGIYSWLPLGHRVLQKIAQIVREEQDKAGAQEMLMPTIQSAELWHESDRYDDYGKEMLRITDRHDRDMLYGPTNEELITDIFRNSIKSYRDLPLNLYHIQWKFRDEIRPRFGVMRSREFLMKDTYSFDLTKEDSDKAYMNMFVAYLRTFARMGLRTVPVRADPGAIGGNQSHSHEFHVLAETGESDVYYEKGFDAFDLEDMAKADLNTADQLQALYAAADEKHDPDSLPVEAGDLMIAKGIEVGHIFQFGTKYSAPMGATVTSPEGDQVPVEMGSYGIGVSRLVAAIIEANHDENGIIWPETVAPFKVVIINMRANDEACTEVCEDLYNHLTHAGVEALYDDRDERAGVKFADAELIGIPWQVVVGPRGVKEGIVELRSRKGGDPENLAPADLLARMTG